MCCLTIHLMPILLRMAYQSRPRPPRDGGVHGAGMDSGGVVARRTTRCTPADRTSRELRAPYRGTRPVPASPDRPPAGDGRPNRRAGPSWLRIQSGDAPVPDPAAPPHPLSCRGVAGRLRRDRPPRTRLWRDRIGPIPRSGQGTDQVRRRVGTASSSQGPLAGRETHSAGV